MSGASSDTVSRAPRPASAKALVSWALYDWANSSFSAVIQTFVFAAYFTRSLAPDETAGTTLWGNAVGAAGLVIALTAPLLGAYTDQRGNRKPGLALLTAVCIAATALLWFMKPSTDYLWPAMILLGVAVVTFELGGVLYNAMLPELASERSMGRLSGWGWGLGYFGGLSCLVLALVLFIDGQNVTPGLDREQAEHVRATFVLVAAWFLVFSLPLFLFTPDRPAGRLSRRESAARGLRQLAATIRNIRQYRHLVRFFIARMIYIDGLTTVFAFGGIYAAGTFGMDEKQVLYFGIGLNITGGLGAALFALLDDRVGGKSTVLVALVGLLATTGAILLVGSSLLFWIIGLTLGLFVGPVQASSRSYLARMAPPELRNEMFGLLAFSGKATAFLGPLLVGWVTYAADSQRVGMSVILLFFLIGFLLMLTVPSDRRAFKRNT